MPKQIISAMIILGLTGIFTDICGCSAVFLNKKGQTILGNNMDWIFGDGLVIVNKRNVVKRGFWYKNNPEWTWVSKYGSITFNTGGREFPLRGANEAGLAIIELMLSETRHPSDGEVPVLDGSQWFQYQMDKSATIADVIASDTVVRIESSDWEGLASHYLICDSTGNVAAIEWLNGQMIVYTGNTFPIPALVNSTYESCLANGDDPSGRFKKISDLYTAYDTAKTDDGISYTFSILEAAKSNSPLTQTMWSMAYDVRAKRYYWNTSINSKIQYVDLKDFNFACGTNVEVLDINSPGSGNVRNAFVPYTTALNRDLVNRTYSLLNQYSSYTGIEYTDDTINAIATFPESTFCEGNGVKRVSRSPVIQRCRIHYDQKISSIRILLPETVSDHISISLFDLQGRIIATEISQVQQNKKYIDCRLSHINQGVYYCQAASGNNIYKGSFIIQQ